MSWTWIHMGRVKRIWYLSPMRAVKVQASLGIRAVSPEPPLLTHTSTESRGTFRQKARSLAPLNGWACAVKICHDGMLEDTNSLDGAQMIKTVKQKYITWCMRGGAGVTDRQTPWLGFRTRSRTGWTSPRLKNRTIDVKLKEKSQHRTRYKCCLDKSCHNFTEFSLTPNMEYFTPTLCLWLQLFEKS